MSIKTKIVSVIVAVIRFIQYGDLPTAYYIKKGMKVGKNFCRQGDTKFDISNCYLIRFGDNVTIANRVIFLAHDDTTIEYIGYRKIGPISVGNNVFFGANSVILLNVKIGNDVIIAAGSVVNRDVPDNSIVAGVPARVIGQTKDYIERHKEELMNKPVYDITYSIFGKLRVEEKRIISEGLISNFGFVRIKKLSKDDKNE